MLHWLRPKCPLETRDKLWIESRMRWLAGKLGLDRLVGSEVILPEPRFFPYPYAATPADAKRIFDRVCAYMALDPARFDLDVVSETSMTDAAGMYLAGDRPRILVAEKQLLDPERLVATIAHELAHDVLLGGGLITDRESDHEPLTDLVPVFLGLGLFTANAPVRDRSYHEGQWAHFQISRQGYLPSHFVGYGLALFAYTRRESKPAWARYLRPDAARPMTQGLAYLRKTGDSLFGPGTAAGTPVPPTASEALDRLATGSATVRAMTLHDLSTLDPLPAWLGAAVAQCLLDRDPYILTLSAQILPRFGELAFASVPDLIRCLSSQSTSVRMAAADALAAVGAPDRLVVPELIQGLKRGNPEMVDTAAAGLCLFARSAATAVPLLVEILRASLIDGHPTDRLADAIVAIDPPPDLLDRLLKPIDREIRREMIASIRYSRRRQGRDQGPPDAPEPGRPTLDPYN